MSHVSSRDAYHEAVSNRDDTWVAACGGYETPFSHNGTCWLYVFNPHMRQHGYLNMRTDIVHDDYHYETDELVSI